MVGRTGERSVGSFATAFPGTPLARPSREVAIPAQSELFLMAAENGLVRDPITLEMNGLLRIGIPLMAKKVGMKLASSPGYKMKQLTITWLYNKLKSNGHLYLIYQADDSAEGLAHAVVCHTVSLDKEWPGVMDPWHVQGFQWPYLADLKAGSKYFIVGYP